FSDVYVEIFDRIALTSSCALLSSGRRLAPILGPEQSGRLLIRSTVSRRTTLGSFSAAEPVDVFVALHKTPGGAG
ncbi:hypothetical protein, partial [Klebsiella pneumoniae]|uniref:hypothetical protein n=1 Tax=Klebsiella pneumoniae TaxID=573 RepID=UPI001953301F